MASLLLFGILFALSAASLLAVAISPAEARPRHHRHHAPPEKHVSGDASRVSIARSMLGMTARQLGLPRTLWCADFINLVERRLGRRGTGSRRALSFARYGRRLSGPAVGAIATMLRRGGGHVGVVTGITAAGDPVIISGNHAVAVRETVYPRGRIRSYSE